jgi:hypothetical protein
LPVIEENSSTLLPPSSLVACAPSIFKRFHVFKD